MKTLTSLKEMATSAKDLADKATEGPWSLTSDLPSYAVSAEKFDVVSTLNRKYRSGPKNFGSYENDAEFIASARTTVPELSAAVVLLCNEVEALMEQLENIRESLASAKENMYYYSENRCCPTSEELKEINNAVIELDNYLNNLKGE